MVQACGSQANSDALAHSISSKSVLDVEEKLKLWIISRNAELDNKSVS